MRNWAERAEADGAVLVHGEGFIVNNTPDDDALEECKSLGKKLIQ